MFRFILVSFFFYALCFAVEVKGWNWPYAIRHNALTGKEVNQEHEGLRIPPAVHVWREGREDHAKALWASMEEKGHFSACWKEAVLSLKSRCGGNPTTAARNGKGSELSRTLLAFRLAKCDAENDGRSPSLFHCPEHSESRRCIQGLSEMAYAMFVQYRLHADVLCAYLQEEVFQERTEAAVAALHEEAVTTLTSMMQLQQLEKEVLEKTRSSIALQEKSKEVVDRLVVEVGEMEEVQKQSFATAEKSAGKLLETSKDTAEAILQMHSILKDGTDNALQSIQQLGNQTFYQYSQIEDVAQHLLGELGRINAVHHTLVSGAVSSLQWLRFIGGVILILLFTGFRRTASGRYPAILIFVVFSASPFLLEGVPYVQTVVYSIPWSCIGLLASAMCVLWFNVSRPCAEERIRNTSMTDIDRTILREELRESFRESHERLSLLLERSPNRRSDSFSDGLRHTSRRSSHDIGWDSLQARIPIPAREGAPLETDEGSEMRSRTSSKIEISEDSLRELAQVRGTTRRRSKK